MGTICLLKEASVAECRRTEIVVVYITRKKKQTTNTIAAKFITVRHNVLDMLAYVSVLRIAATTH